ncbi:MAG: TraR/DksA family transcriptional regulator [Planctomycetes bacterium]|jgi:RNA polymerase-binding protein DksA|nr:TraR/DksA family transcriptional regulator [Planctomycetota bacterium]
MKKADLTKFKKLLIEKRQRLADDIKRMTEQCCTLTRRDASGDLSHMPIHMADVSADNYEQEITMGLIETEEREMREIEGALKRIDDGSFGVCEACNGEIKAARLKAIPNARLCIKCKQKEEEDTL